MQNRELAREVFLYLAILIGLITVCILTVKYVEFKIEVELMIASFEIYGIPT